jgi:hypothetical protein
MTKGCLRHEDRHLSLAHMAATRACTARIPLHPIAKSSTCRQISMLWPEKLPRYQLRCRVVEVNPYERMTSLMKRSQRGPGLGCPWRACWTGSTLARLTVMPWRRWYQSAYLVVNRDESRLCRRGRIRVCVSRCQLSHKCNSRRYKARRTSACTVAQYTMHKFGQRRSYGSRRR